jgi:hypothetical protein
MALARPIPYSWSVADTITVTILNGIRDALTWSQNPPLYAGIQTASQSIPNTAWTPLSLDTAQVDTYTGHSSTNPSRYTCQTGAAGYYMACGVYAPIANSTGFRAVRLQTNGTAVIAGASYLPNNGSVEMGVVTPTKPFWLNVGDYVETAAWQSSGGALGTSLDSDLRCGMAVWFIHA